MISGLVPSCSSRSEGTIGSSCAGTLFWSLCSSGVSDVVSQFDASVAVQSVLLLLLWVYLDEFLITICCGSPLVTLDRLNLQDDVNYYTVSKKPTHQVLESPQSREGLPTQTSSQSPNQAGPNLKIIPQPATASKRHPNGKNPRTVKRRQRPQNHQCISFQNALKYYSDEFSSSL